MRSPISPTIGGRIGVAAALFEMPNSFNKIESSIRVAERKNRLFAFAKLGTDSIGTICGVISSFRPEMKQWQALRQSLIRSHAKASGGSSLNFAMTFATSDCRSIHAQ